MFFKSENNKFSLYFFVFIIFILSSSFSYSQENFNDFKHIISEGEIPNDFTLAAFEKINEDILAKKIILDGNNEFIFLKDVHYAINDLLHSGMVVYGDDVTNYINRIADKLLLNDSVLRNKLRFYTIKSNESNAFSTYQGIIFVTTGLIAQVTSEAQLAYILSHEIAHFTENHIVEFFEYDLKNKYNSEKIKELSHYSREHEFEADKIGVKLYNQAGYSKEELISTFDVLLYSYLPFEEMEFPKNYFNSDLLTIPEYLFPNQKFPINAAEDVDDSESSHPNIKKRKEAVKKEIETFSVWGKAIFLLEVSDFESIRGMCRFESIRTDIVDAEFDNALYSIAILEKKFPNSIYLRRMKAKAWLGIAQYKSKNDLNSKLPRAKKLEGEIANLQSLLKNLTKNQILTIALRQILDLKNENPSDEMIQAIYGRMIKTLVAEKFELNKFKTIKYHEALKEKVIEISKNDSIKMIQKNLDSLSLNTKESNKYESINKFRRDKLTLTPFDSTTFYLYALTDVISDTSFISKINFEKNKLNDKEIEKIKFEKLSNRKKRKIDKYKINNSLKLGIDTLVYVEPLVVCYEINGKEINQIKSEKLAVDYEASLTELANYLPIKVTSISSAAMGNAGTKGFNQKSILNSYLNEKFQNKDIDVFPTDYIELSLISKEMNTDKIIFSILENQFKPIFKPYSILMLPFFYIMPIYLPIKIYNSSHTFLSLIILDISKNEILEEKTYYYNEPLNKYTIMNRMYDVLKRMNSKPSKNDF